MSKARIEFGMTSGAIDLIVDIDDEGTISVPFIRPPGHINIEDARK